MAGGHADIMRRASDERRRSGANRREPLNMLDAIDVISNMSPAQRDALRMLASPAATVTAGGSPRDRRRRSRSPSPIRQYPEHEPQDVPSCGSSQSVSNDPPADEADADAPPVNPSSPLKAAGLLVGSAAAAAVSAAKSLGFF
ncbi:hypothetical protein LTR37_005555 [Vermiconidia calcicola]|uniref:Uncharacterized protein n=1 Tax=Vermiconidia calcicola TaxID=1690605 RepID=A0ACC3NJ47_9PEZI|nr:hypothetical protein LTR37_005555 [Vermiconidia calcicola]